MIRISFSSSSIIHHVQSKIHASYRTCVSENIPIIVLSAFFSLGMFDLHAWGFNLKIHDLKLLAKTKKARHQLERFFKSFNQAPAIIFFQVVSPSGWKKGLQKTLDKNYTFKRIETVSKIACVLYPTYRARNL